MKAVGVIGMGFVGNAVANGLRVKSRKSKHNVEVLAYDKFRADKTNCSLQDIVELAGVCFVCVPTPMNSDGSSDISIVRGVVSELSAISTIVNGTRPLVVVVKSTVPPGTCASLQEEFTNVDIVFNPEFLTEANAENDFLCQDRIVLGGDENAYGILLVEKLYSDLFECPVYTTSWTTAEMVKYTANCFLATKVSFANEIKQIATAVGVDYDEMIALATLDRRLGDSHWRVPGPMPASDGSGRLLPGFSGSCFVKDINALISVAGTHGVKPTVLHAAWQKNLEVRPERDWKSLVGRAISNSEDSK